MYYVAVAEDIVVASLVIAAEGSVEVGPRDKGDEPNVVAPLHKLYDGLGCGKVKALGHAYTKLPRTLVVERGDNMAKLLIDRAIIIPMSRKGDYLISTIHAAKIRIYIEEDCVSSDKICSYGGGCYRFMGQLWREVCYSIEWILKHFTTMKNSSLCLLSALGGAVVGAVVAMLVTPQSGSELRSKIRTAVDEAAERMRHHKENCTCGQEGCECDDK